jgi:molybdate transport system substrate-binding protein
VEALLGISSMATRRALADLAAAYESRFAQSVEIVSIGGVDALRRIDAGEAFDFAVLAGPAMDELAASGRVDAHSRVGFARSEVALAVRSGAPRPDASSERSIRAAVAVARTIGCSTGPSGAHLARLLERWGLRDDLASRIVQVPPGVPVGDAVARGEAEIGFQQLSELIGAAGIDVVGPLPPEIQDVTVFGAAVCTASRRPDAARTFVAFLATAEASEAKRRHGLEPAG